MKLLGGCGNLVIPAGKLLNHSVSRSKSQAFRKCRHLQSDQLATKRHSCAVTASAAVVDRSVDSVAATLIDTQQKPSFRAFLDFKALKADLDKHVQNCENRSSNADPARVIGLYDQFCEAQQQLDSVREERNSNAKAMKVWPCLQLQVALVFHEEDRLDQKAVQGKLDPDQRQSLIQQGKDLKDRLAGLEAQMEALQDTLQREGQRLPNLAHPSVSLPRAFPKLLPCMSMACTMQ